MSMHPSIAAALAEQRRSDLITDAEMYRLASTARRSRVAPAGHVPALGKIILLMTTAARRATVRVLPSGPAARS
jgi:hypothetical protein